VLAVRAYGVAVKRVVARLVQVDAVVVVVRARVVAVKRVVARTPKVDAAGVVRCSVVCERVVARHAQVDAVAYVRACVVARKRVAARMGQANAFAYVRACGVARKRVAARRVQVDAEVVVRAVVIRDVAVIRSAEINPSIWPPFCPCRCESCDVHVVSGHIKDVIARTCRGHSDRACALASKREVRCRDVHVLGVAPSRNTDRLARVRIIDHCLYRRPARVERAAVAPPARFVHTNVAAVARDRGGCCRRYDNKC